MLAEPPGASLAAECALLPEALGANELHLLETWTPPPHTRLHLRASGSQPVLKDPGDKSDSEMWKSMIHCTSRKTVVFRK